MTNKFFYIRMMNFFFYIFQYWLPYFKVYNWFYPTYKCVEFRSQNLWIFNANYLDVTVTNTFQYKIFVWKSEKSEKFRNLNTPT